MMFCQVFLVLLLHTTVSANLSQIQPGSKDNSRADVLLDCSKFQTDHDILESFRSLFPVDLNPVWVNSRATYGLMDNNDNVYNLNIVNEVRVPSCIFCFEHLKKLRVRRTRFDDGHGGLSPEIERLAPTLKKLIIDRTTTTHLPKQIGYLKHLEELELIWTGLTMLPDSIGSLSSLALLDLQGNNLTSLPLTITNMPKLVQIILDDNPHLRSVQSLNGHSSLKRLHTDNCPIERIPFNLPQLTHLYMTNNNLTNLIGIKSLGYQTNASKSFYFGYNRIHSIPPHIQNVSNLSSLKLNHNQLEKLPSNMFAIKSLQHLDIQNNQFNSNELKQIIQKFNSTNPSRRLVY